MTWLSAARKGDSLPELKSASGRVKVYEDAGAATQPSEKKLFGERATHLYVPGYSKDGRYAIVRLLFPWSGIMHSGEVTYVLERSDRGWKVLLRDFVGPILSGPVFEPLKDPAFFARAALDPVAGTVVRPNDADLAPEALHDLTAIDETSAA